MSLKGFVQQSIKPLDCPVLKSQSSSIPKASLTFLPRFRYNRTIASLRLITMASRSHSTTAEPVKLTTYVTKEGDQMVGVVSGGRLWAIKEMPALQKNEKFSQINSMMDVIQCWELIYKDMNFEGTGIKLEDATLLAPIPKPTGPIMCVGKNYVDHVKEVDTWKTAPGIASPDIPKHPIIFTKAPQSVIGTGVAIRYPHDVTREVDYEAELAVVIGKSGRGIKKEDAMSHVFGYTILNDVTARDLQKRHQQWFLGKSCDTFCPMGPWIVPASEINGQDLQIQCWINNELRQVQVDSRTSKMIFSIPELIETISSGITLQLGDIIATGTPSGVGSGFNPPKHLLPGDTIQMYIEGIGELVNYVV